MQHDLFMMSNNSHNAAVRVIIIGLKCCAKHTIEWMLIVHLKGDIASSPECQRHILLVSHDTAGWCRHGLTLSGDRATCAVHVTLVSWRSARLVWLLSCPDSSSQNSLPKKEEKKEKKNSSSVAFKQSGARWMIPQVTEMGKTWFISGLAGFSGRRWRGGWVGGDRDRQRENPRSTFSS